MDFYLEQICNGMLRMLKRLREPVFGSSVGHFYIGERRGKAVMMSELDLVREEALDVLEKHGIRAQFYMPAAHAKNQELADALRLLAGRGYIMTNHDGSLVGAVATARMTADESAQQRRAHFKVIKGADRRKCSE